MKRIVYLALALLVAAAVSCKKDDKPSGSSGTIPQPTAVDIGMVVDGHKVLWANCNLGASKEYEFGNYYAWGELEPKTDYSWETYAFGLEHKLTKYCPGKYESEWWDLEAAPTGADNITKLLPSDDVAHVKLGGNWRLPTFKEAQALCDLVRDKEHYERIDVDVLLDENGNEIVVNGKAVTGIRIARKGGNSIFFPAAGYAENTVIGKDYRGFYWTSSLSGDRDLYPFCSPKLLIWPDSDPNLLNTSSRFCGLSIRPVWVE